MSKTLSYKQELYRKIIHTSSILFPILYIFISKYSMLYVVIIATIITVIIDINREKSNFISNIFNKSLGQVVRKNEKNTLMSASYLMITSTFLIILFPESIKHIPIISITYCSICDTFAAIYGIKYGKIKLLNNKTLEGMFAFIISGIIVTFIFIITQVIFVDNNLFILLTLPFFISVIELISTMKYDNITVPIFSSIILYMVI